MRRFLGSAWYPLIVSLILGGAMIGVFAILAPTGESIGSSSVAEAFKYVGWAAGGVVALLVFLTIGLVNLIRRIVLVRRVQLLHPLAVVLGILPFLIFGWELTYVEQRFTPIARAIIDFVGEPLYAGSVVAVVVALILAIPLLLRQKK